MNYGMPRVLRFCSLLLAEVRLEVRSKCSPWCICYLEDAVKIWGHASKRAPIELLVFSQIFNILPSFGLCVLF